MESWNPLSNVAWTGPFNPCVHFPWLQKCDKYPDQALRGRVLLTHLETPLKDTRLGNKPKQMKKKKPAVCSSGEDVHSPNSCDKVLIRSLFCQGRIALWMLSVDIACTWIPHWLSSFELLWFGWNKWYLSNSLAVCEAHNPGILQINSALDVFDMQNILAGHLLASEKDQLPSLDQVCPPLGPLHTQPHLFGFWRYYFFCDLD